MNSESKALPQSEAEAQERRAVRAKKLTREWTVAERREAFLEAREAESKNLEAGVLNEWDLCDECHDYQRERGSFFCSYCIHRGRQYAD